MAEITGTSGPVTKIDVLGGVPGAAGVSVTTTELDANGHLLIGKSNGVTLDVGKVRVDVTPEVQAAWDGAVAAETEATKQAGIATDAASNAATSESNAASSESHATSSASSAAGSANAASSSATAASGSANAAALSASSASGSATAAATSAAQFSTWFLRGNGSPVGVITPASAGVQYVDLQATCGARVWISTGTTASAWRVADGDTGKRYIEPDFPLQRGRFAIQRINGTVYLFVEDVWAMSTQAGTDTRVLTIPANFTVTNKYTSGFTLTSPFFWRADFVWVGDVETMKFGADSTAREYCRDTCVLNATNAYPYWPTTLPGVPA